MNARRQWWAVIMAAWLMAPAAWAVVTIHISHGYGQKFPIAIVPFRGESALPPMLRPSAIVRRDLQASGWFQCLPVRDYLALPHHALQVEFNDWRLLKATALLIGHIQNLGNGQLAVSYRLFDVDRGTQLAGFQYEINSSALRAVGHRIADVVYKALTGIRGIFATRIAFVTQYRDGPPGDFLYELKVADAEGHDVHIILRSRQPIMAGNWSPHGRRLAYVSFETGWPAIYIQDVATGQRHMVADFHGLNSAPAFAPDGTHLAMCLSKSGYPEIYVMNLKTHKLRQLTFGPDINTEPSWSPGGHHLVFTSNRSGQPQIYEMNADGSHKKRLTFQGRYNADASFSPNGQWLTLVSRRRGQYHTAVFKLADATLEILTHTALDQSPTFAPNGQDILYSTVVGGHRVLAVVAVNGQGYRVLGIRGGDISDPAWSPFRHQ